MKKTLLAVKLFLLTLFITSSAYAVEKNVEYVETENGLSMQFSAEPQTVKCRLEEGEKLSLIDIPKNASEWCGSFVCGGNYMYLFVRVNGKEYILGSNWSQQRPKDSTLGFIKEIQGPARLEFYVDQDHERSYTIDQDKEPIFEQGTAGSGLFWLKFWGPQYKNHERIGLSAQFQYNPSARYEIQVKVKNKEGEPIETAGVFLEPVKNNLSQNETRIGITGSNGEYIFSGIKKRKEGNNYNILVIGKGFGQQIKKAELKDDYKPVIVEFMLEEILGKISGRVDYDFFSDTGVTSMPIDKSSIKTSSMQNGESSFCTTFSREDGTYEIDVPFEEFKVSVAKSGLRFQPNEIKDNIRRAGDQGKLINFKAYPSVALSGFVKRKSAGNDKNLGVPGVKVYYAIPNSAVKDFVVTTENGFYQIPLPYFGVYDIFPKFDSSVSSGQAQVFTPMEAIVDITPKGAYVGNKKIGTLDFELDVKSAYFATLTASQIIDNPNKLIKGRPVIFRVYLYSSENIPDKTILKDVLVSLRVKDSSNNIVFNQSQNVSGFSWENQIIFGKLPQGVSDARENYIIARKEGSDAVNFPSHETATYIPDEEGFLHAELEITNKSFSNPISIGKTFIAEEQKKELNIAWLYCGSGGKTAIVGRKKIKAAKTIEREINAIFPIGGGKLKLEPLKQRSMFYDLMEGNRSLIDQILSRKVDVGKVDKNALDIGDTMARQLAIINEINHNKVDKVIFAFDNPLRTKGVLGVAFGDKSLAFKMQDDPDFFTVAHELGHTYYMPHSWEEYTVLNNKLNPSYDIILAEEGWDLSDGRTGRRKYIIGAEQTFFVKSESGQIIYSGPNDGFFDFMGYIRPHWINRVHYETLFDIFSGKSGVEEGKLSSLSSSTTKTVFGESEKYLYFNGYSKSSGLDFNVSAPILLSRAEQPSEEGSFKIESYDKFGNALSSYRFNLKPFYYMENHESKTSEYGTFNAYLPYSGDIAAVKIFQDDFLLQEINSQLQPQFASTPIVNESEKSFTVSFEASDEEQDYLEYSLFFKEENSENWNILVLDQPFESWDRITREFSKEDFSGAGRYQVKASVSDGLHSTESLASSTFFIDYKPPVFSIESPLNGSVFLQGENVYFQGAGMDEKGYLIEDDNLFDWLASFGQNKVNLGRAKELRKADLALGRYTIFLEGQDLNKPEVKSAAFNGVDIEVDNLGLPDISVSGMKVEEGPNEKEISVTASLFNIRKSTLAKVSINLEEPGSEKKTVVLEDVYIPANQVTPVSAQFPKPQAEKFFASVEVICADDPVSENNIYSITYPYQAGFPAQAGIKLYPKELEPNKERRHISAAVQDPYGEEIKEYLWVLDDTPLANNNKPSITLDKLASGKHILELTVKDEEGLLSPTASIEIIEPYLPQIQQVDPASSLAAAERFKIIGSGFYASDNNSTVLVSDLSGKPVKSAKIVSWSDTQITCEMPAFDENGDYNLQVETVYGLSAKVKIKYAGIPVIKDVSPDLYLKTGQRFKVYGKSFYNKDKTSSVLVSDLSGKPVKSAKITSWSDTQITCEMPTFDENGKYNLQVKTAYGSSNAVRVIYAGIAPTLRKISPGYLYTGKAVTLYGDDFGNSDWKEYVEIKVDDTGDIESVQPYEWTNKKISFTLPKLKLRKGKDFGTVRIKVVTKAGKSGEKRIGFE